MASPFLRAMVRFFAGLCVVLFTVGTFGISHAGQAQLAAAVTKSTGKLSSRLALIAQTADQPVDAQTQARALGLAVEGPGSLLRNAGGDLLVYIRLATIDEASLAAIRASGAQIVHIAPSYRTVTAYVRPDQLVEIAALRDVQNVREELQPKIAGQRATTPRRLRTPWNAPIVQAACPSGVVSEGDTQLKAAQARSTYAVNGAGITVGILSDSFAAVASPTSAAQDVASGDLPGPGNPCGFLTATNVISETATPQSSDEGRAMAQIVHDLAPGANLAAATAFNGLFAFADNIVALRTQAGADVIVDDVGYFAEPFFQDGPISNAIEQVTSYGATYFTAAGNSNAFDQNGNSVGSYEAPLYRPTACPALQGRNGPTTGYAVDCHSFNPAGTDPTNGVALVPGAALTLIFQWAEPWYGVTADLDVYVVNSSGQVLGAGVDTNNGVNGTQQPFEALDYRNNTGANQIVFVIIARSSGSATPRLKYITDSNGLALTEYNATSNSVDTFGPTVYGHATARSAISTAAVPYDDATQTEEFSSRGPATIYFGPTNGTTVAATLAVPDVRNKPDLAATDGGRNTFFGSKDFAGVWRFTGTSAAAPHAAAVAALMKQQANQRGKILIQAVVERLLEATATPIASGGSQATGAGLVNALNAVGAVNGLPTPQRTFLPIQTQR